MNFYRQLLEYYVRLVGFRALEQIIVAFDGQGPDDGFFENLALDFMEPDGRDKGGNPGMIACWRWFTEVFEGDKHVMWLYLHHGMNNDELLGIFVGQAFDHDSVKVLAALREIMPEEEVRTFIEDTGSIIHEYDITYQPPKTKGDAQ